ncbi:hypothetical protein, partial [Xanthomonas vasicola]
ALSAADAVASFSGRVDQTIHRKMLLAPHKRRFPTVWETPFFIGSCDTTERRSSNEWLTCRRNSSA